jgi:hypothetical protein
MQEEPERGAHNFYQQPGGAGDQPNVKTEAAMLPNSTNAATSDGFLYQQGMPVNTTASSGPYSLPLHHMATGGMAVMGGPLVSMSNLAAMYQQVQVQLVKLI